MSSIIDLEKAGYPNLADRRVVIAGGTGDVGEGLLRSWLKTGAQVIVPSRTEGKVERFCEAISDLGEPANLHFVTGSYASFDEVDRLAQQIVDEHGPVTDVVAALGGWWQGKLLWEISSEEWQRYFIDASTAHFASARAWSPRLPQSGSYQLILGGSATQAVPKASIISMQQAALLMMRRALSQEAGDRHRVASQILGPVVTRARKHIDPEWVSNVEVGLVSAAIAADPAATGTDYVSYDKKQMLETLQKLNVYPR
ncbi:MULTISPECIES: SDR family NAD(P)-dependent oxidoreductase [Erythrobacteraceae]|uniref:SDR family NAD(P)-dependent oxidoreductase n=1 Tax=Erythrobacteraceae TaxID=335929 RepID=UPI000831D7CB|nr:MULTISPECIES: SDR family oxidoreductase [Erythrobacteraceae]MDP5263329.1 SDR family oxidoreductase [Aurantiacibacter sp. 219JJ12-13]